MPLFNIMRNKNCTGLGAMVVETTTMVQQGTNISEDENLTQELKDLSELHKSGALTDEEFTKAKSKILN